MRSVALVRRALLAAVLDVGLNGCLSVSLGGTWNFVTLPLSWACLLMPPRTKCGPRFARVLAFSTRTAWPTLRPLTAGLRRLRWHNSMRPTRRSPPTFNAAVRLALLLKLNHKAQRASMTFLIVLR